MGLYNKIKAGVKNVDSKLGEGYDVFGLNGKIKDEKKNLDKHYMNLGELCYQSKGTFTGSEKDRVRDICSKIDDSLKTIAELEKQLNETKDAGKKEREANRKSA